MFMREVGKGFSAFGAAKRLGRFVEPSRSRLLTLPLGEYAKKKSEREFRLFLEYGGEEGIRTLDTLPYTHFPGVLLQPLGHLTILFAPPPAGWQRGATIGSRVVTVKQIFSLLLYPVKP